MFKKYTFQEIFKLDTINIHFLKKIIFILYIGTTIRIERSKNLNKMF